MSIQGVTLTSDDIQGLKLELSMIFQGILTKVDSLVGLGNPNDRYVSVGELSKLNNGEPLDIPRASNLNASIETIRTLISDLSLLKSEHEKFKSDIGKLENSLSSLLNSVADDTSDSILSHSANVDNPHQTTAVQVGSPTIEDFNALVDRVEALETAP